MAPTAQQLQRGGPRGARLRTTDVSRLSAATGVAARCHAFLPGRPVVVTMAQAAQECGQDAVVSDRTREYNDMMAKKMGWSERDPFQVGVGRGRCARAGALSAPPPPPCVVVVASRTTTKTHKTPPRPPPPPKKTKVPL